MISQRPGYAGLFVLVPVILRAANFSNLSARRVSADTMTEGRRNLATSRKNQRRFPIIDSFAKNNSQGRVGTEGCRGLPYFDEQKKTRLRSHLSA